MIAAAGIVIGVAAIVLVAYVAARIYITDLFTK